jgi:hypothetical protein
MKKHIITVLCVYLALQGLYSCKKSFLDEKLYSNYAPEKMTDSLGVDAAAIGLYYQMGLFFSKSDRQGWPSVWHAGTDVAWVPPTQKEGIEVPYYDYTQLISTDAAATITWNWAYQMINNANNIIVTVESPTSPILTEGGKTPSMRKPVSSGPILITCWQRCLAKFPLLPCRLQNQRPIL